MSRLADLTRAVDRVADLLAEQRKPERVGHARRDARRLDAPLLLTASQAASQFKEVPSTYIFEGSVNCLCGGAHELGPLGQLTETDCGRWLIATGEDRALCYREEGSQ